MTKKKLSDIFREKIISRKERNSYGDWEVVEKVFQEKRPVDSLSSPLRLLNHFIDILIITLLIAIGDSFLDFSHPITLQILTILIFFSYYISLEFYFQQTIGKYFTRSLVVNEYGEKPDLKTIFLRTVTRIIPLNPYSFFWTDDRRFWHDKWTKTFVLSKDELSLIKRIQSGEKPHKSDIGQWDEWYSWQQRL